MSWDVLLFKVPDGVVSIGELPQDHRPEPLGSHAAVQETLRRALADVDLSDPTWGTLVGSSWSIELNIGREDPVDSIMLHVRGGGDDVMIPIFTTAAALGCRVLDCSTGDFIEAGDSEGWHAFQAFRDHVAGTFGGTRSARDDERA